MIRRPGKWYENPNSSDNPQSLAGLLKMTALQFVQEYGWTELMDGTSTGVTDNDNNSASGSFQSNGFLYNVAVSFINNYSVPQPQMYTVTFYQEDRTSVVDTAGWRPEQRLKIRPAQRSWRERTL